MKSSPSISVLYDPLVPTGCVAGGITLLADRSYVSTVFVAS
jgi:hypothetical protein